VEKIPEKFSSSNRYIMLLLKDFEESGIILHKMSLIRIA